MKRILIVAFSAFVLWSCGETDEDKCEVIPETTNVNVTFESFEDSVVNFKSKQEMIDFFTRYPLIRDYIFKRTKYPGDQAFIDSVYSRLSNPHLDTLLNETRKSFGDLSGLKAQFTEAFSNVKYYYPEFVVPKVQTIISGLETDMYVSDTLIIVGLDYYLGKEGKYRPQMYDYLLRQYNPENIVPSTMLIYGIGSDFNKTNLQDKTILADMISYGKSFYFAKRMLPCVPDSVFIWYTPEEITGSRKNQDLIWARLVQDEVLFESSHLIKQKYLGDRPKTVEVGPECPGRIGQFVGWQMVRAYMKSHPETTLQQMMAISNAQTMYKDSKYKPKRGK
jgi:hypothetical protein